MNTMTVRREFRYAAAAASIVAFWSATALLVFAVHRTLEQTSPAGCLAAKLAVILLAAFAYMRHGTREATVEHALYAGITWALASIAAELIVGANIGHPWFALLGSPANGAFRNMLLIAWIGAPALFARSRR